MAPDVRAVWQIIPNYVIRQLRRWVGTESWNVCDLSLRLSTKWTPALLIAMMCIALNDNIIPQSVFQCETGPDLVRKTTLQSFSKEQVNSFCWNDGPFLVKKGLHPSYEKWSIHPGVIGYEKGVDQIIKLHYYKHLWIALVAAAALVSSPLIVWKPIIRAKLECILGKRRQDKRKRLELPYKTNCTRREALHFFKLVGLNDWLGFSFMLVKLISLLTVVAQSILFLAFISFDLKFYGIEVLIDSMFERDTWPNRMLAIFPTVGKCDYLYYGRSGDWERVGALCNMPMNAITCWTFFIWWWWTAGLYVCNAISLLYYFLACLPCLRNLLFERNVAVVSSKFNQITKLQQPIIKMRLSYGDWILLQFIDMNLTNVDFVEFIHELTVLQSNIHSEASEACSPYEETGSTGTKGLGSPF